MSLKNSWQVAQMHPEARVESPGRPFRGHARSSARAVVALAVGAFAGFTGMAATDVRFGGTDELQAEIRTDQTAPYQVVAHLPEAGVPVRTLST